MDAALGPAPAAWSPGGPVLGPSYTTGVEFGGLQPSHSAAPPRRPIWGSEAYPSLGGRVRPLGSTCCHMWIPRTVLWLCILVWVDVAFRVQGSILCRRLQNHHQEAIKLLAWAEWSTAVGALVMCRNARPQATLTRPAQPGHLSAAAQCMRAAAQARGRRLTWIPAAQTCASRRVRSALQTAMQAWHKTTAAMGLEQVGILSPCLFPHLSMP